MRQISARSGIVETRQDWIIGRSMTTQALVHAPTETYAIATVRDYEAERLELLKEFRALRDEWKRDTAHLSLAKDMVVHWAYQRIIGRGFRVVPLIIEEMRTSQDHWFWALRALTGENPVKPEHRGNVDKMTQDWIGWWESLGVR